MKTQKISSTEYSKALSLARVTACLAIVVLHTVFAANEYFADTVTAGENLASRIVENNMMWAVPVFLMVTGALQLNPDKELTMSKLYGKYIARVAAALVVFSLLFRLFDIVMDGESFSIGSLFGKAGEELITGHGWGHLWYLYLLIGLYVLLPFYRTVIRHCSDTELKYLACVYVFFISIIPAIESFGVNINFYISESIIYPLYLLLGYMIYQGRLTVSARSAALLAITSTALIILLDILRYGRGIEVPGMFFGYASPLVIVQAVGVFALIMQTNISPGKIAVFINSTDRCTFGIYLISMVFVRLVFKYMGFNPYEGAAAILLILSVIGIFAASYLVTAILKLIPGFRKIL